MLDHAVVSWLSRSPPHRNIPHGLSLKHLFMRSAELKPCNATVPYKKCPLPAEPGYLR